MKSIITAIYMHACLLLVCIYPLSQHRDRAFRRTILVLHVPLVFAVAFIVGGIRECEEVWEEVRSVWRRKPTDLVGLG